MRSTNESSKSVIRNQRTIKYRNNHRLVEISHKSCRNFQSNRYMMPGVSGNPNTIFVSSSLPLFIAICPMHLQTSIFVLSAASTVPVNSEKRDNFWSCWSNASVKYIPSAMKKPWDSSTIYSKGNLISLIYSVYTVVIITNCLNSKEINVFILKVTSVVDICMNN